MINMPTTITSTITVVSALISGVMPVRLTDRISTGRVDWLAPASMLDITTSSMDSVKERNAAETIPGMMLGIVTRQKVWTRLAPKSMEASCRVSLSPEIRPLMVITAYGIQKVQWPIIIVPIPRLTPTVMKMISMATASTISGTTIGTYSIRPMNFFPRNSNFFRPIPPSTPMITLMIVASTAMTSE